MKKLTSLIITLAMIICLMAGCGSAAAPAASDAPAVYKVGICNFVDDASLNQIVANIENQLAAIGEAKGVTFDVKVDNCMADPSIMEQIIANFIADGVDIMVGVATPVAMQMQAMTEENNIPVIYSAVSSPVTVGLANEDRTSGKNISGTSDYFDTTALFDLIFALNPDAAKIGLLYDVGQSSSTEAIASAKAYLEAKGVEYVEKNGTTTDMVIQAATDLANEGVDAVFTPSDNTIMTAELAIYEILAEAGVPHFAGADSFALNGAFLGYGVDYANLGVETANMVADVLLNGTDISTMQFMTFDNGIATVNTDICEVLGLDFDTVAETLSPLCTQVQPIVTADSFDDLG